MRPFRWLVNCSYRIEVLDDPVLTVTDTINIKPLLRFERIVITGCFKAFKISDPGNKEIELNGITITKCTFGIDAKITALYNKARLNYTTSSGLRYERITISECQKGIQISDPTSKNIVMNKIHISNCVTALDIFDPQQMKRTYLCNSGPSVVYVASSVEVRARKYYGISSSQVSNTAFLFPGHLR